MARVLVSPASAATSVASRSIARSLMLSATATLHGGNQQKGTMSNGELPRALAAIVLDACRGSESNNVYGASFAAGSIPALASSSTVAESLRPAHELVARAGADHAVAEAAATSGRPQVDIAYSRSYRFG